MRHENDGTIGPCRFNRALNQPLADRIERRSALVQDQDGGVEKNAGQRECAASGPPRGSARALNLCIIATCHQQDFLCEYRPFPPRDGSPLRRPRGSRTRCSRRSSPRRQKGSGQRNLQAHRSSAAKTNASGVAPDCAACAWVREAAGSFAARLFCRRPTALPLRSSLRAGC